MHPSPIQPKPYYPLIPQDASTDHRNLESIVALGAVHAHGS